MKLLRKFFALFRKNKLDAEMAEEMRLHLEQRTRENVARGMSPEEARFAARRKFGGVEQAKEIARDGRGFVWLEQARQDLRYAARQLVRTPGFTAVVVLTLALGIGATTAIFSVVNTVILNPLPGSESDRLMQVGEQVVIRKQVHESGISPPVLQGLLGAPDLFSGFTWHDSAQLDRKGDDFTTKEFGAYVATNFFAVLGAQPMLGRAFAPDEGVAIDSSTGRPATDAVIVLSHAWWKSQFGGDPKVIGTAIELSQRHFTVIGVMPEYFKFPQSNTAYWVPAQPLRPEPRTMRAPNISPIVRLKPGVAPAQFRAMLDTLEQRLMADYPASDRTYGSYWRRARADGLRLWSHPLRAAFQDGYGAEGIRRTLWGFFAAIAFVLMIVCANVANLALARTERRQHELAVRAALGAGRARLLRQLLTENLLLATLGGVAGLVVTAWAMPLLASFNTMPRLRPLELDGGVLGVALLVTLLSGLIFGLAPAWRAGRVRASETLSQGGQFATGGRRASRFRGALVVVQVALTVVLLAGAGLMLRSVVRLLHVDPGFDPENVIVATFWPNEGGREQYVPRRNAFYANLHERLAALPGVKAVGILRAYTSGEFQVEGRTDPVQVEFAGCGVGAADYFRALRIPLRAGRYLEPGDIGENVGTVVINETMAELCWPGGDAVGKTFRTADMKVERSYRVVGMVGDARADSFDQTVRPMFYRPYQDFGFGFGSYAPRFALRTESDPGPLVTAIRRELKAADPAMQRPWIASARQTLFDSTRAQRTYRNYLGAFAGLGLLLSALGIYGVLAYSVARRTREIGIRLAIGAERRHVMGMVMAEGARLIAAGAAVGVIAAWWLTQFLRKQLFEIDPRDPAVLGGVVAALSIVALFACWLPARRAAKVDPMVALRCE
jgi:putative ABC transport system permease protein